jgi:mannosyltransferase
VTTLSDAPLRKAGSGESPSKATVVAPLAVAGLAVVAAVGAVFFFYSRSALWLDEALTVNISRLPLSHLHDALKQDGAPPLYYVLLHFWTAALGTGDVASRAMSGLFMSGAVVATWFAARRFVGTSGAWVAAVVMVANPYAIRYATEARMYSLEILLVASGIVAVQRALEKPVVARLAVVGALVALLVYNQYWSFYLLAVVFGVLLWTAWRGPHQHRDASRRVLIAMVIGALTFLPWLPTFLYQRAHTGTPWGEPSLPGIPLGYTLRDFAGGTSGTSADRQEGWLLLFVLLPMLILGVFGRPIDDRRIEVDLRVPREARLVALLGGAGLVVALTLNYIAGGAFQSRYSAIVFPFFILLIARGFTMLRDPRILAGVLVVTVLLGFSGGVRNVITQRTQAPEVAAVLRHEARPGDLVVYCPDQVGPSVHRLVQPGLDEVVYPTFRGPEAVDWVDYTKRLAAANVGTFAHAALTRAGAHTLWYVSAPGYITHKGTCEALSAAFALARTPVQRTLSQDKIFEKPSLQMFPARSKS